MRAVVCLRMNGGQFDTDEFHFVQNFSGNNGTRVERVPTLVRPDAVETLRVVRCFRVGEFEMPGPNFRDAAEHRPVAQRQRYTRGSQRTEARSHSVAEAELNPAIR